MQVHLNLAPYRNYYLAHELSKDGHDVMIICASYSHVRNINPSDVLIGTGKKIDGIQYEFVRVPKYKFSKLSRLWGLFSFLVKLPFMRKKVSQFEPDFIFDCTPGNITGFSSWIFSKVANAKLILEVRIYGHLHHSK